MIETFRLSLPLKHDPMKYDLVMIRYTDNVFESCRIRFWISQDISKFLLEIISSFNEVRTFVENKFIKTFDLRYPIYLFIENSVHNWKSQAYVSNVKTFVLRLWIICKHSRETPLSQSARTDVNLIAIFVSKLFRKSSFKCHGVYLLRAVKRSFFSLSLQNSEQKFN